MPIPLSLQISKIKDRISVFLIPFAALLAILPILLSGPSCGHDFDFHLLSWREAAAQFAQFHYPHWAYTPAYFAGEPRFLFYPPLSWTLGAGLGLMLPWHLVPAAFTFTALTLSGLTMYRLARRYTGIHAATLAAVLYLANPYMLFTAYTRTAYGELLAAAWLPLLFYAAFADRIRIVALAVPIALLWLTNAPAAVMSCYALAFVTLLRLASPQTFASRLAQTAEPPSTRGQVALSTLAATILGIALAAFYILPAAYERRYIQFFMAFLPGFQIQDNFLFHRTGSSLDQISHDDVLRAASILALLLVFLITVCLLYVYSRFRPRGRREPQPSAAAIPPRFAIALAIFAYAILFLLTPLSYPLWHHLPNLQILQFPWRILAMQGVVLSLAFALCLIRARLTLVLTALLACAIAAALVPTDWQVFHQACEDGEVPAAHATIAQLSIASEPTDEYTPGTADNDSLKQPPAPTDPPYWFVAESEARPGEAINLPAPIGAKPGPAPNHLGFMLPKPRFLILNRRQFPGWHITLNGQTVQPYSQVRDDGLITLLLPAGLDDIELSFPPPPEQEWGLAISLLALASLLGPRLMRRRA